MAVTQYIGSRYVPLFADPMEWSSAKEYEPLTIVLHEGNSFTSKQFVPVGIDIVNETYWAETGNYNAQVEQYRRETAAVAAENERIRNDIKKLAYTFDTSNEMQVAENLFIGAIAHTNGFANNDDGGGCWYIIVDETPNGMDLLKINDNLTAKLIPDETLTPVMFGAVKDNDDVDNSTIINYILSTYHTLTVDGMYTCKHPIIMNTDDTISGISQFKSGFNFIQCNGVRINRRTSLYNLTIDFTGNYNAIYFDTQYTTNVWLTSVCRDITINHIDREISGCGICIIGTHVTDGVNGAYGAEFSNVAIRNEIEYGIRVVNKATSTSYTDTWFTNFIFNNVFIGRAKTAIESVWVDTTGGNVPNSGNGPRNSTFVFNNCAAQYTEGVSECCINIQNGRAFVFNDFQAWDYYHLRYSHNLPMIKLNANTNVCASIELNNFGEIDVSAADKYIQFENSSDSTIGTFWTNFKNVIINLRGLNNKLLGEKAINGRVDYIPFIDGFRIDDSICETYPELIVSNVVKYVGMTTSGMLVYGLEYTNGNAIQFIITTSANHAYPTIRCRRKSAGTMTWEGINMYELSDAAWTRL